MLTGDRGSLPGVAALNRSEDVGMLFLQVRSIANNL